MTTTTTTTQQPRMAEEEFCSTTTTTTTTSRCWEDEIPTEIMAKILSMVPIRRLLQCKCVSKTWFYTISHHIDPADLFSANQEPGFIVIERPLHNNFFTRLSFNLRQVVKPNSIDSAPLEITFSNTCTYQSSCNGFICLKHYNSNRCSSGYRIIVCNPYLLEATTLPDIINSSSSAIPPEKPNLQIPPNFEENYGLGFSPATNQYKVVRLTWFDKDSTDMIYRLSFRKNKSDGSIISYHHYRRPEEIKILTLGGDSTTTTTTTTTNGEDNKYSSWRDVSSVPPHPIHGTPVYANGFLYWQVDLRNSKVYSTVKGDRIVSFDVEKEKFYITSQPPFCSRIIHLINLRGCLAMVQIGVRGTHIYVWVLQHLNNNNNYQQQQQQQQQWIREYSLEIGCYGNRVIGLWEQGEILCSVNLNGLISYDPKTNKKRKIRVRSGFGFSSEIHGHTGSLVSLKAYGCKTWMMTAGGKLIPSYTTMMDYLNPPASLPLR